VCGIRCCDGCKTVVLGWTIVLVAIGSAGYLFAMTPVDAKTLLVTSDLAKRLRAHVDYLASPELKGRKPGTAGNRSAAEYIQARFREMRLESLPSLRGYGQRISSEVGDNLIGVRPAASAGPSSHWILIGAHYDHLGGSYLGADDNASAVGIMLETARLLPPLAHTHMLFVAFNAEEPPYIRTPLMGSQYFVDHLPAEIDSPSNLQAVVIMDLMGGVHWEPLRDVIFAAGAEKSPGLYRRLKEAAQARGTRLEARGQNFPSSPIAHSPSPLAVLPVGLHLVEEVPLLGQVAFSDYDAFRNTSVPFLFLSAGRTPRYHQPTDLPDTLHYERMAATVEWLLSLAGLIDQDNEPYRFEASRVEFADEVASLQPLATLAADRNTMIPGTSTLSLWRLKRDQEWFKTLNSAAPSSDDLKRLESLSLRLQCLLADFPACFLL